MAGGQLSEIYTGTIIDEAPTASPIKSQQHPNITTGSQLTSQSTPSVDQSHLASRDKLQHCTNVEDGATYDQWPSPANSLRGEVAKDDSKKAAGLECADNVGFQ